MSRIARTLQDPKNPLAVAEHLSRIQRVVDGDIEFGNPNSPTDPASTTRATGGTGAHNGTLVNVSGAWVEISITATGSTRHTCTHNLNVQAISAATRLSRF